MAGYLAKQGRQLLADSRGAQAVEQLLASGGTVSGTRELLERAVSIRSFAVERLGLRAKRSYTRYKELERDHLADVVSAAGELSLEPYLWRYPVLGSLPYRGFYDRADAEAEASRLQALGYETVIRAVDAFSTLGLAGEPLYSFMERYSAFDLAETMIHEMAHATLFVRGQPGFNEELATVVGQEGALQWLAQAAGAGSAAHRQAVDGLADADDFAAALRGLAAGLAEVYASGAPRGEKLSRKAALIGEFRAGFDTAVRAAFRTDAWRAMDLPALTNAVLSLYGLYGDDVPLIREYWRDACGGDIRRLLERSRALARAGDVKEQMRRELGRGGAAPAPRR
jgi:predicted aminopeptidase